MYICCRMLYICVCMEGCVCMYVYVCILLYICIYVCQQTLSDNVEYGRSKWEVNVLFLQNIPLVGLYLFIQSITLTSSDDWMCDVLLWQRIVSEQCMCVNICMYMYVCVREFCTCVCIYVGICKCIYVCMYMFVSCWLRGCVKMMYIYICVCVCICTS